MKKLSYLSLFYVVFLVYENAYGQKTGPIELEHLTKVAIQNGYAASIRIWGFDTLRKIQNSAQFSGVVVSADGHILTAAHAIVPNGTYKVRFPDGKEVLAVALGKIAVKDMQNRPDAGMMKITSPGTWPVAEMGWSYSLKQSEPCVSISYPETLNQLLPTVRSGKISAVINRFGFVQSTCKMEPGDSGGPLFDYFGRVIGLHSRCNVDEDINFEVPVDVYRKYWTALTTAKDYATLPIDTDEVRGDHLGYKISLGPSLADSLSNFSEYKLEWKGTCGTIESTANGRAVQSIGTIIVAKGKYYLIGKSSETFSNPMLFFEGKSLKLVLLKRDVANDLALLRLEGKLENGIPLTAVNKSADLKKEALGNVLISVLPGGQKVSVLGSLFFSQPRKFSAGFLGAPAKFVAGKIQLSKPIKGSPAELANLQAADVISSINGISIVEASDYGAELVKYNPLDTVAIKVIRGENALVVKVVLGPRPTGNHVADQFKGGKSKRLDGFERVFSHDPVLTAAECGGPVFDLHSRFLGINIARFSRTTTLVMPAALIYQLFDHEVVNKTK